MDYVGGLSTQEAQSLAKQGKANITPDKSSKSVPQIVASNVFTYFNAIFAVLAALLIYTGSYRSLTFLPVVVANMVIGIVQQMRAKKVLDELALLDVSEYEAIRDGQPAKIASTSLVLGDVIILESGQQIPADAEVVSGEASVNESLLTGEADEIEKTVGDELKSGSFLVSGKVQARLTHVGADSYASKLMAQAKEAKEHQSEMVHDIETIVRWVGIIIIPLGALLAYRSVTDGGESLPDAINSMVGAVTGMIPEGLYLLVTIALAMSASRLAKKKVLLHDMRSVETLARVDVLCVDKTGTITSDQMNVAEVFGPEGQNEVELAAASDLLSRYIRTVPDNNITMNALRDYFPEAAPLEGDEVMPFSSKDKFSCVRVGSDVYRLGAPEFLLSKEQLEANKSVLEERTGQGLRVLALVHGEGASAKPLVFVALINEIRKNARQMFEDFAAQGVEIKVISGDNPLTVATVAGKAGIANTDRWVDATTLDSVEKIADAVEDTTIFGRVKPDQKKAIVEALKAKGYKVAMTGDGVNDILAMKEADCSIAMGGGSDAARQAAQVVLLDSDFSHMNDIVAEGRRDINNITRSATLFLYKNIFSLLLALFSIATAFVYPLRATQVSLISMFNIGLPAFFLAFEPNEQKQEGRFIKEVLLRAFPASLTSFFAIAAMMSFAGLFDISATDVASASTYLLAAVGVLILYGITFPHNRYRLTVIALCILGFAATSWFGWSIFDIRALSPRAFALCVIFGFAEIGVLDSLTFFDLWLRSRLAQKKQ